MPCWAGIGKSHKNNKKPVSVSVINETQQKGTLDSNRKSLASVKDYLLSKNFGKSPLEDEDGEILSHILSFLPVNSLLQARLVCKKWNTLGCSHLRKKIEGAIILQRGMSYYTKSMKPSLDIPIGRLFLKIDDINDPAVPKFFETVGHSILYLVVTLEGSSFAGFLQQLPYLKNLEQLSVNLFKEEEEVENNVDYRRRKATSIKIFIEDYDAEQNPNSTSKLLNLESLVLSCEENWKHNEALLLEKILDMSPFLRNINLCKWPFMLKPNLFAKSSFLELKFLCLHSADEDTLKVLGKKKLPNLKTVEFELGRDMTQETLQIFIDKIAPTLEYIEVKNSVNPYIGFKLTKTMKKLTTIRLPVWIGPVFIGSITNFAPILEKLQLSNVNPDLANVDHAKPLPSLVYLAINFGNFGHTIVHTILKTLVVLVSVFPNVKTFMMKKVSDKILEIICDAWGNNLEALRITTSFALSDSGITGLPSTLLKKSLKSEYILGCGCRSPVPVKEGKPQVQGTRITANITSLQKLKDLRIDSEAGSHWTLSNLSLHLGISELRQLNSLRLTCHELGPHWCLRCISNSFPYLQNLTIMDRAISHDRYDEQEIQYLLRRLPRLNLTFTEADSYTGSGGSMSGGGSGGTGTTMNRRGSNE